MKLRTHEHDGSLCGSVSSIASHGGRLGCPRTASTRWPVQAANVLDFSSKRFTFVWMHYSL